MSEQPAVNPARAAHIPALDGVRGIAILMVLFEHFTPKYYATNSLPLRFIEQLAHSCWMGVDLFFVLSGFLITGILLRARSSPRYFISFYGRRALRIFPIYYLVLVLVFLSPWLVTQSNDVKRMLSLWPWYWFYATNYLIALRGSFQPLDSRTLGLGHFWSLAVEEHFYLLWPTIVWICSERTLARVCLAIMATAFALRCWAAWVGHDLIYLYVTTHCRMDSLAVGALLAVLVRQREPRILLRRYKWVALSAGAATVIISALQQRGLQTALTIVEYSIVALAFAAFICLSLCGGRVSRMVSSRPLRFFGIYSYGIYIYHGLFATKLTETFSIKKMSFNTGHLWLGILPHYVLCIGIPLVVAILSYHLIEMHFLKLKRFFQ